MGKWLMTVGILLGCAVLTRWIPFSSYFRNVDTMIHEFGHALVTLLFSGRVMNVDLYADHSGVTRSVITNEWAVLPIGLAGYLTASLLAWWLFALYAQNRHRAGLWTVIAISALSLLLFVRNSFGVTWLAGFLALSLAVQLLGGNTISRLYYLFVAFLTLEESVMGPASLVLYAVNDPMQAGDATLLSRHFPLPAVVWALLMLAFALWCAKKALDAFIRGLKAAERQRQGTYLNG